MSSSPVYLVYGNDEYLVSQKAKAFVGGLVDPNNADFGLEIIDGNVTNADGVQESINRCTEALMTVGLFGGRKVVWLQDASFFQDAQAGKSERARELVDEFTGLLKSGLPTDVFLVISAPKVDKRRSFFKTCKALGEIHEFSISEKSWESEKNAKALLLQALKAQGVRMNDSALDAFLSRVGTDTRQIYNEVEKVSIYVGDRKEASAEDVNAITSASRSAIGWDFADAVGQRNLSKALTILRQLLFQGESYMGLISMLQSRVRELVLYRDAIDQKWLKSSGSGNYLKVEWTNVSPEAEAIFSDCFARDPRKTHPFRVKVLAVQASKFSMKELVRMQGMVIDAQEAMITSAVPPSTRLELLLSAMLT